jgi:hypothetical protein
MKIMYSIKPTRGTYDPDKYFSYGKIYDVIADYTKRKSGQCIPDNGYVVLDNTGQNNMLFANQITMIDDKQDNTFIF